MALSSLHKMKVLTLFGIPSGGATYEAVAISTLYGPFGESYDHSAIITAFNTKWTAAAADSDIDTLLTNANDPKGLLTRLDEIGLGSVTEIDKDAAGASGVIVNDPKEIENIRQAIATLIGFVVPEGGFRYTKRPNGGRVTR